MLHEATPIVFAAALGPLLVLLTIGLLMALNQRREDAQPNLRLYSGEADRQTLAEVASSPTSMVKGSSEMRSVRNVIKRRGPPYSEFCDSPGT